jgi:hypothetical protein
LAGDARFDSIRSGVFLSGFAPMLDAPIRIQWPSKVRARRGLQSAVTAGSASPGSPSLEDRADRGIAGWMDHRGPLAAAL